jgi:UDP-N-acetyl-D-mannosaminuronate dehydrogenase
MKVCVIGHNFVAQKMVEILGGGTTVTHIDSPYAVNTHDVYIICCEIDSSSVFAKFSRNSLVVIETISPDIGTVRKRFEELSEEFDIVYSPSRLDQGRTHPLPRDIPKIVGGLTQKAEERAVEFYRKFFTHVTGTGGVETAEAAKLYEEFTRMINIAHVNDFSDYCVSKKLNPYVVLEVARTKGFGMIEDNYVPWVGMNRIPPMDEKFGPLVSSASTSLYHRPRKVFETIVGKFCKGNFDELNKLAFLVVGITYKQAVCDYETKSPVAEIVQMLVLEGARVEVYDMFVPQYNKVPELVHQSGKKVFTGILVFHPYLLSQWQSEYSKDEIMYFCHH